MVFCVLTYKSCKLFAHPLSIMKIYDKKRIKSIHSAVFCNVKTGLK